MNRFSLSKLTAGLLLAALAAGAQAADVSTVTDTVKGRAPVAGSVSIANQTSPGVPPQVGHMLQVDYDFTDADGDAENGTAIQWMRGSTVIGTSSTYTAQSGDVGQSITAQVTPKTNPDHTEPFSGAQVTSAAVTVELGIASFITSSIPRSWAAADGYCKGVGARLPTALELEKLFVSATSATVANGSQSNNEMCSVHGWCSGGKAGTYWSSTVAGHGAHIPVDMNSGMRHVDFKADAQPLPVACVR